MNTRKPLKPARIILNFPPGENPLRLLPETLPDEAALREWGARSGPMAPTVLNSAFCTWLAFRYPGLPLLNVVLESGGLTQENVLLHTRLLVPYFSMRARRGLRAARRNHRRISRRSPVLRRMLGERPAC